MKLILIFSLLITALVSSASANTAKDFGKWSLLCGDKGNCTLSQIVSQDPNGKNILLGANISKPSEMEFPVLVLRLPASLHKESGVGIKVDEHKAIQIPVSQCASKACQTIIQIDKQLLQEMMTGKEAKIAIAIEKNKQLTLPLSLEGFTMGYQALLDSKDTKN